MEAASKTCAEPVHLLGRRLVCENSVFSVYLDHVSGTQGTEIQDYLSVVPRVEAASSVSGVSVLLVCNGRFGLIRVFRHPVRRWGWEVPKGFIDAGETAENAALRELREETGFWLATDRLRPLPVLMPEPGVIMGRVQPFVAEIGDTDQRRVPADSELGHDRMQFFGRDEIRALTAAGEIGDAATLALLFLCDLRSGN